jgi:hypothetical protein
LKTKGCGPTLNSLISPSLPLQHLAGEAGRKGLTLPAQLLRVVSLVEEVRRAKPGQPCRTLVEAAGLCGADTTMPAVGLNGCALMQHAFSHLLDADHTMQAPKQVTVPSGGDGPPAKRAKTADGAVAVVHRQPGVGEVVESTVVRIRGLPWEASSEAIEDFFKGLDMVEGSAFLCRNHRGRTTGEGYVKFASVEEQAKALQRHRQNLGDRYIEVFSELEDAYDKVCDGVMV